jgi:hypothetical protein
MVQNNILEATWHVDQNGGSFGSGSVGGSVESGSVMSVEERKEIELQIDCYRKLAIFSRLRHYSPGEPPN